MTTTPGHPHGSAPEPTTLPRRRLLALLGAAAGGAATLAVRTPGALAAGVLTGAPPADPAALGGVAPGGVATRPDVVGDWFDELAAVPAGPPGTPDRTGAIAWLSALSALDAGVGLLGADPRSRFADAAVATAVHDVAAALVPDGADRFAAALARSLAAVPDGDAKAAGIRAGRDAAARTLADRAGDGFDPASLNPPFTPPPEAPGIYRLPPGAAATQGAGIARARPFLLDRADRFRPGPPPALGTDRYRRDLEELRRLGGAVSERTARQSDIAWLGPQDQYGPALRALLGAPDHGTAWRVRLLAAYSVATLDAVIAVSDAKFAYLHWRPVTAIRAADTDGDPLTDPDPGWTSYLTTPPNPEYPSAHAVVAGAAERVLTRLVGPRTPVAFTARYRRGDGTAVARHYRRGTPWTALTRDNVDARVWAGVHFRSSDEVGAALGRRVGDHDLGRLERR